MDSMVEENGGNSSIDPLSLGGPTGNGTDTSAGSGAHVEGANVSASDSRQQQQHQQQQQQHQHHHQTNNNNNSEFPANILTAQSPGLTVLKNSAPNIVHLITHPSQSSVIQSSVIQSANHHLQPVSTSMTSKGVSGLVAAGAPPTGHTVYVSKSSSVIQAPGIRIKTEPTYSATSLQAMDSSEDDDSCSDEDAASRKRRDMLTRRPSYHKILKEISGPDMSVIPTTTLQLAGGDGGGVPGMHGGHVQYISGQEFYVPAVLSGPVVPEDQSRKREIRLQKNREAARECRRKKKEYIKCLENRVAVLENQNKALIEELKSLKELYCMTKTD